VATSTALGASPSGGAAPGATVTLTATVTPSSAAGSVQFKDGNSNLGTPVEVTSGSASTTTAALTAGSHALTAVFTPTDASSFTGSTSPAVTYLIANVPGAPSGVTASAHPASATVSWTAPADNGGAAITGYDVQYSSNGGGDWTSASSSFHTSTATAHTITGLANGTGYVFRVAAINLIGTGAYSSMSSAVQPRADATTLAISKSTTIAYGKSTTITAKLSDATTHANISAATLTLLSRTSTAKPFTAVKSVKTSSTGVASVTVAPKAKTYYEWKYAGSTVHAAKTSASATVSVAKVVTAAAKATRPKKGVKFSVYGTVAPALSKLKVSLQQKVGSKWKTIATAKTASQKLPTGKKKVGFVFTLKEKKKGKFSFRVVAAATSTLAAGTSKTVVVHVV
jgi:fibronectin type III domain protein/Big-like domain-containing protein